MLIVGDFSNPSVTSLGIVLKIEEVGNPSWNTVPD